jgi:hypothetical protein
MPQRRAIHAIPALFVILLAARAAGAGWHDYRLEIAPGFAVERMNSFQVCLAGREGHLVICPIYEQPAFGPLVEYAVTDDFIITKNLGAQPHEKNPVMWQGDPTKEFFFVVRREDEEVTGPLTQQEWEQSGFPALSSLNWATPRNPNFWTPLLGDLLFLGFAAVYFGWPVLVLALVASLGFWLLRRNRRNKRTAA